MAFTVNVEAIRLIDGLRRHFSNSGEILDALQARRCPPTFRTRSGLSIRHAWPEDPIFLLIREIFVAETYTGDAFLEPAVGQTIVDCGANIGVFALYLSGHAPGIAVHCFEPSASTRERLIANVRENRLRAVRVYPFALWSDKSQKSLLHYACSGRRSFFADDREEITGEDEIVECVDLQTAIDLTGAGKIDLLKMDVEGAELEIIEAASPDLWNRIDRVVLEYHEELRIGSQRRIMDVLKRVGYCDVRAIEERPSERDSIGIIRAAR